MVMEDTKLLTNIPAHMEPARAITAKMSKVMRVLFLDGKTRLSLSKKFIQLPVS